MSDYYHAVVEVEATPDEAESLAQEVVRSLVAEGVVQSTLDPEAAFGGPGAGQQLCGVAESFAKL